ncbi:RagB/SusD family nutrient uptake outer membrane protein [Altibacter sp.]|uniref:RagB/SusD family nutrient uptake outer membrane protein n=1 Tax=Altibacter sp. TaxID=2024823 RepID=UPI0025887593|nr:RagB/SusD family nutrient uptake outer membrane protein [Altibacter sp.]MCW8980833.1 RagB/SusD family nutrient uptake outer membrane protein [Altibacter sp.]MCW9038284.1 RagB/SusD family nutrient uptake outer membrane protein [Altibacter sp.]
MKIIKIFLTLILTGLITVSCEVEEGQNLNGPTTDTVSDDLSRGELQEAMGGALSDMRERLGTQVDAMSVAGREYWRIQSSDPRWTADLLTGVLDNNTFYTTNPYAARYATIKDINLLLTGLENTTADFSNQEIAATRGFANTLKAHELLMVLNHQYKNGIRIDVSDPDNLGPFVPYEEALTTIFQMLSDAAADLSNGGGEFPFSIPSGFAIASTPSDFLQFNRALAARVEVYRGNYASANSLLQNSFMDLSGNLDKGVYFTFSLTGADMTNPLFFALNSTVANARIAHPTFIDDALPGDDRVNKAVLRDEPLTSDNLTGSYDVFVYQSNEDPVAIIRNEELLLLYAEANHISNPAVAVAAIDVVRTAAGLDPYTGGTAPADLVDEILYNRRYSLFAEGGHRWIDLRRFNRLGVLPIDRAGDAIFEQFPIPLTENQ